MTDEQATPHAESQDVATPPEASFRVEVWRKALHLLALVIPAGMAYLERWEALAILIPATLICLATDFARAYMPRLAGVIDMFFGFMMRPEERGSALQRSADVSADPKNTEALDESANAKEPEANQTADLQIPKAPQLTGATWVMLSASILTVLFPREIGAFALGMFMICDAAAALVGKRFGRFHWFGGRRTLEGSLAFFITGCVIAAFFPGQSLAVAMMAVVVATVAEIPQGPGNDNLRVPIVAAALMAALYAAFGLG